jgi:hypothetical protein
MGFHQRGCAVQAWMSSAAGHLTGVPHITLPRWMWTIEPEQDCHYLSIDGAADVQR